MKNLTELATFFKERDNKDFFGIQTAEVISINPIVMKLSEKVFLSKEYENLKIAEGLTVSQVGDELIVIPTLKGDLWYAIAKLGVF